MKKRTIFKKENFSFLGYQVKEAYVLAIESRPTRDLIDSLISRNEKLGYKNPDMEQGRFFNEYIKRLIKFKMKNVYDTTIVPERKAKIRGFIL
jgi:hypothetical protein